MTSESTGTLTVPPTDTTTVGTLCWCGQPACPGTGSCYRKHASSETTWRLDATRRPNWVLADGTAV